MKKKVIKDMAIKIEPLVQWVEKEIKGTDERVQNETQA